MTFAIDAALVLLVLAVAVWTIAARDTFAAVVGFVAYGLLLALAWVRLHAVDVALTEAAIGGGLTGVLLIGAAARLRRTEAKAAEERPSAALRVVAALLAAAVATGLASRRSLVAGSCTHACPRGGGKSRCDRSSATRSPRC